MLQAAANSTESPSKANCPPGRRAPFEPRCVSLAGAAAMSAAIRFFAGEVEEGEEVDDLREEQSMAVSRCRLSGFDLLMTDRSVMS